MDSNPNGKRYLLLPQEGGKEKEGMNTFPRNMDVRSADISWNSCAMQQVLQEISLSHCYSEIAFLFIFSGQLLATDTLWTFADSIIMWRRDIGYHPIRSE